jgi:hypothetical protein
VRTVLVGSYLSWNLKCRGVQEMLGAHDEEFSTQALVKLCELTLLVNNTPRHSFYVFRGKGILMHFEEMLHNLSFIFHKMLFIS